MHFPHQTKIGAVGSYTIPDDLADVIQVTMVLRTDCELPAPYPHLIDDRALSSSPA